MVFAVLGGWWAGGHGAASGALGATINLIANFVYALMGGIVRPASAAGALLVIMRAEGFKIVLILVGLFLVSKLYRNLVAGPFILAFVATALMFVIALQTKNQEPN